jgi:hypothetical protein
LNMDWEQQMILNENTVKSGPGTQKSQLIGIPVR